MTSVKGALNGVLLEGTMEVDNAHGMRGVRNGLNRMASSTI